MERNDGLHSLKCEGCTFARGYGAARLTMEMAAAKHAREHPGHVVQLRQTIIVHRFSTRDMQLELQGVSLDTPPF